MATTEVFLYVETKSKNGWRKVSDLKGPPHLYHMIGDPAFNKNSWYNGRSYNLFALLAGVRNSDMIPSIKEPIGIPSDVSSAVKKIYEKMGSKVYNSSSYTLKELLDKKDITFNIKSILDHEMYKKYKKGEYPEFWYTSQQISIADLITNERMDKVLKLIKFADPQDKYYTEVSMDYPYKKVHTHFWEKIIPAMQKLGKDPDNVRIVFWFED
jgi:hypothetical protein